VPPYVKAIRRIFELTLPEAFEGLESVHYLQAAEFEELAGKLTETQERLKKLSKIVASRMSGAQSRRCAPLAQANEN
jgi:hypothetical protein